MASFFLSYSREDAATAAAIEGALTQRGMSVWRDDQLLGGDPWPNEINKQFLQSHHVIFLISRSSFEPGRYQSYELEIAHGSGKVIIPVLHGGVTEKEVAEKLPILGPLTKIRTSDSDVVAEEVARVVRRLRVGDAARATLALALADLGGSVAAANTALRLAGIGYQVRPGHTLLNAWHDALIVSDWHDAAHEMVERFVAATDQPYARGTRRAAAVLDGAVIPVGQIDRGTIRSKVGRLIRDGIVEDYEQLRAYAVLHVWPEGPIDDGTPLDQDRRRKVAASCRPLLDANGYFADRSLPLWLTADLIVDRVTPSRLTRDLGNVTGASANARSAVALALTWAPALLNKAIDAIKDTAANVMTASPSGQVTDLRSCIAWLAILREAGISDESTLQTVVRAALMSGHAVLAICALEAADEKRTDRYQTIWAKGSHPFSAVRSVKRLAENGSSVAGLHRSLALAVPAAVLNAKDADVDALRIQPNNVQRLWLGIIGPILTSAQEQLLFDIIAHPIRTSVERRLSEAAALALAECDDLLSRWLRMDALRRTWIELLPADGRCESAKQLLASLGEAGVAASQHADYFSLQRYCTRDKRGTTNG